MKILKNEKDVTNPILQTNVIRKNPLYHKCYNLYKFIERYNNLGVNYSIDEKYTLLNEEERQEMNANLLSSFLSLKSKAPVKVKRRKHKVYKQKVLTNVDEDIYVFSPASNEPLEFIRIDEGYRKAMAKPDIMELPKIQHVNRLNISKKNMLNKEKQRKKKLLEKLFLNVKKKKLKTLKSLKKSLLSTTRKSKKISLDGNKNVSKKKLNLLFLEPVKKLKLQLVTTKILILQL